MYCTSLIVWVILLLLMSSAFKCHTGCPRTFNSSRGLRQHRAFCSIYATAHEDQIARVNTTFRLTEEPPNKRIRQGGEDSPVCVENSTLDIALTSIPGH